MKNKWIRDILGIVIVVILASPQESYAAYTKEKASYNTAGVEDVLSDIDNISRLEWNHYIELKEEEQVQPSTSAYTREAKQELSFWGYHELGVSDALEGLNIRETASGDAKQVGMLPYNAGCEIISVEDGWSYISSGKVTGYVSNDYLLSADAAMERAEEVQMLAATVTAQNLKVRKEPNTNCKKLGMVKNGTTWQVLEDLDGWVKIAYDGREGYVSKDYITISYVLETALTMTEVKYGKGVTDVGIEIAEYAVQFVGNPYVYGGTSLTKGADCSGFTLTIFKKYGVTLPHSARRQSTYGTEVAISDLRPGDLVFYSDETGINHVTIYIGDNKVVHASSPKNGIKISKLTYRTPTCARRLVE